MPGPTTPPPLPNQPSPFDLQNPIPPPGGTNPPQARPETGPGNPTEPPANPAPPPPGASRGPGLHNPNAPILAIPDPTAPSASATIEPLPDSITVPLSSSSGNAVAGYGPVNQPYASPTSTRRPSVISGLFNRLGIWR
jgi:hypothetical protein